jgi:hypothetical protein
LYKTKPRTAQREVNALVRKQIEGLMLDVRDVEHYPAIDFLRDTYGKGYARSHGYDATELPDRLLSDRTFVAALEQAHTTDPAVVEEIYQDAQTLLAGIQDMKIHHRLFDKPLSWSALAGRTLLLALLLPLWIFSLWPNALHFVAPALIRRRMTDKMFYGTFLIALSILVTIPVLYTLTFALTWIFVNVWAALVYVAALPFIGMFAWYYRQFFLETQQAWRYRKNLKKEPLQALKKLKTSLYDRLDELLTQKNKH